MFLPSGPVSSDRGLSSSPSSIATWCTVWYMRYCTYSVVQKGLSQVARTSLETSENGQLVIYGLAELLAAL